MPVTKAQTAAKVKYERTAYDKVLLRIEKETDEPAEASADSQEKEDKRRRRKGRNQDMPTKGQIEQAAKAANETLNGYILKAVKQRMERDSQGQKSEELSASPAPESKENGSSCWADDPALPWNSEQPHDQHEAPAAPKRKITSIVDLVSDEDRKRIRQESEAEHLVMPWEEPETPPTPAAKPDMDAVRRQIASMTGFDSKPKHEPTAFSNDPCNNDFG